MVLAEPWKLALLAGVLGAVWVYRKRLAMRWARRFSGPSFLLRFFGPLSTLTMAQMENARREKVAATLLAVASGMLVLALAGPAWPNGHIHLTAAALLMMSGVTIWQILPSEPRQHAPIDPRSIRSLPQPAALQLDSAGPPTGSGGGTPKMLFLTPGGYDPSERRHYQPGDDLRFVDWSATARSGKLVVKLSSPETELNLWLLADGSARTQAGTTARKWNLIVQMCALLARGAALADARVGLALFSGGLDATVAPQVGKQHAERIVATLARWAPRDARSNLPRALAGLLKHVNPRHRGTVFIVSDFGESLPPEFAKIVRMLQERRQKVVAIRVLDPLDEELPDLGTVELENADTGESDLVNTSFAPLRQAYSTAARGLRLQMRQGLQRLSIPIVEIRTTDTPAQLVVVMSRLRQMIRSAASAS